MSSTRTSTAEAYAQSARMHQPQSTRDIEIKGKIYTFIYETEDGYQDISSINTDKIQILAESILNAHSTSNPTLANKQIDYIDKKGIHYKDQTVIKHKNVKLGDAYSGLDKVTKMTELTEKVSAFLAVVDKTPDGDEVDDSAFDLLPFYLAEDLRTSLFHSGYEKENVKEALKDAVRHQINPEIKDFYNKLNNGERIRFHDGFELKKLSFDHQSADKFLEDINNLMKDFSLAKHAWEKMIQTLTDTDELYSKMSLSSNSSYYIIGESEQSESEITITVSDEELNEQYDEETPLLRGNNGPRIDLNAKKPRSLSNKTDPFYYDNAQILYRAFGSPDSESKKSSLSSSDSKEDWKNQRLLRTQNSYEVKPLLSNPKESKNLFQQLQEMDKIISADYDDEKEKEYAKGALEALENGKGRIPKDDNEIILIQKFLKKKEKTLKSIVPGKKLGSLKIWLYKKTNS